MFNYFYTILFENQSKSEKKGQMGVQFMLMCLECGLGFKNSERGRVIDGDLMNSMRSWKFVLQL